MARLARLTVPGLPHLVSQHSVASRAAFRDDVDRALYLRLLAAQCRLRGVDVLAWCLVSEGVEMVAVPAAADALARALGEAHRLYVLARNRAERAGGRLFRSRFGSCVLDERHLAAAVRRVLMGPVRLGLAQTPSDWPWCSAGCGSDPDGAGDLPGRVGGWLTVPETDGADGGDAAIRLIGCLRTGRPAGGRRFVVRIERLTGRRLRRGRPGRPRRGSGRPAG